MSPHLHRVRPLLPQIVFFCCGLVWLLILGNAWLAAHPSHEELVGYAGKLAWLREWIVQGDGPGWWVDGFLGGFSAVAMGSYALALVPYAILAMALPDIEAFKVGGLLMLGLGGWAVAAFARALTRSVWTGCVCGLVFLFSAQPLIRLGTLEHMTIVSAFPLVPLSFLAMLRLAENGGVRRALWVAVVFSAALLCWTKAGATLSVALGGFALALCFSSETYRVNLVRSALWAVPAILALGVVPLLPLVREFGFMTVFENRPFDTWQAMYSAKTAASWLDRGGDWFRELPSSLRVDAGAYYLGMVPLAAVAVCVIATWRDSRTAPRGLRLMLMLALGVFWLSFGPRSVMAGHFEFMSGAFRLADWSVLLPWAALIAPAVLFWWLLPESRLRVWVFFALVGVYYFVPGFVWIERIPVFGDLRAPDSFWMLNGAVLWAVAGGIAITACLGRIADARLRVGAAVAIGVLVFVDLGVNARGFFQPGLPGELRSDFGESIAYLRESDAPGRVAAHSGRYFFLEIPAETGRGLASEAAHHNFKLRDSARLRDAAGESVSAFRAWIDLAGVSHVWVDRTDRETRVEFIEALGERLPITFSNPHFVVFENRDAAFPAFFAARSRRGDLPGDALDAVGEGVLLVDDESTEAVGAGEARGFQRLDAERSGDRWDIQSPGRAGYVVLSQAWHPDWHAQVDGSDRAVVRAGSALPAVRVSADETALRFSFRPPRWYALCGGVALVAWIGTLAFLLCGLPRLRRRA